MLARQWDRALICDSDVVVDDCLSVFVVDDVELFREAVRAVMDSEDGLRVVGEASSVAETLDRLAVEASDIVLMDVEMPGVDGIAGARLLRGLPGRPLVMLCSVRRQDELPALPDDPGIGFVLKDDLEPRALIEFWERYRTDGEPVEGGTSAPV